MLILLMLSLSFAEEHNTVCKDELFSPSFSLQEDSLAQNNPKKKSSAPKKKKQKKLSVPIEIGVGPTAYHFGSMNGTDRLFHSGLSVSGHAIISNTLIHANKHMIPKEYRKAALAQDELRISKLWIPESIIISPSTTGTSAFGASFRPVAVSLARAKNNKGLNIDFGARATYAYIRSVEEEASSPHFLGLGIDGRAEIRVPLYRKKDVQHGLGLGWSSHLYLPQALLFQNDDELSLDPSQWHVGQAFVKYYYQFPFQTSL